jgi:integrase
VRGLPARASSTKGTYRSVLHRLARENGRVVTGQGVGFQGAPAPAPYSLDERAELYSMARAQPGEHRGPAALVVLSACIGAGLRAGELVALCAEDVATDGKDVVVQVRGQTPRHVVVRPPYGKRLAGIAVERGTGVLFRPGLAKRSYKNAANDLCSHLRCAEGSVPLSVKRCRSSFICDHLDPHGCGRREK